MIELESTWSIVVMLLVAGGVGMIGGVGAGLLEMRRAVAAESKGLGAQLASPSEVKSRRNGFWSSVILGGIAAVAVLYFFPPAQETVTIPSSGAPDTTTSYDLTKLVGLALIVGSAGAAFLQVMQTRALALASADRAKGAEETGVTALKGVPEVASEQTKSSVKEAAGAHLVEAGVSPKKAERVADQIAEQAGDLVKEGMGPYVENAQKMVTAAGPGVAAEPKDS